MISRNRKIFTIGYQGLSIGQFIAILRANSIEALIDIRESPYSRNKAFSKKNLAASLKNTGIEYHHLRELGSPPELRRKVKADHDYEYFFRAYTIYLSTQSDTLDILHNIKNNKVICLSCYEHDPAICHRRIVSERLAGSNNIIINL